MWSSVRYVIAIVTADRPVMRATRVPSFRCSVRPATYASGVKHSEPQPSALNTAS